MAPAALVTGCSSGFGLEATVALARRGWRVFATMRDPDRRAELDRRLTADCPGAAVDVLGLDVTDPDSVTAGVDAALDAVAGHLDGVVNNAGVSSGGAFEDMPDDEVRRVLETNFFGTLAVTRAALPAMRRQRHGRLVMVTSVAACFGTPGQAAYAASKWAVEGWAESLALEVASFGITVCCVEPGTYRTGIWDSSPRLLPEDSPYHELGQSVARYVDERAVPRARDPRQVGEVIARALTARRPRFRYPVGPDAMVAAAARGVVPNAAVRLGVNRVLGLGG